MKGFKSKLGRYAKVFGHFAAGLGNIVREFNYWTPKPHVKKERGLCMAPYSVKQIDDMWGVFNGLRDEWLSQPSEEHAISFAKLCNWHHRKLRKKANRQKRQKRIRTRGWA